LFVNIFATKCCQNFFYRNFDLTFLKKCWSKHISFFKC
jgi:hypothetical protein